MRHQLKARKVDLLRFIAKRQIVTSFDVAQAFGYSSHKSAKIALYRLAKKGLVECEISPDGQTKNWWLTPVGKRRMKMNQKVESNKTEEETKDLSPGKTKADVTKYPSEAGQNFGGFHQALAPLDLNFTG